MLLWFCFFEAQLATNSDSRTCPKMAPKCVQNGSPNGSKIDQKSILEPLRELLELSWQPGGLLGASWKPLGTLLDPKKHCLERPLAGPRAPRRPVSAILGSKRLPKWSPKGSQIEPQKGFELKWLKSQNSHTVHRICLIFEVPDPPFGDQNGFETGYKSHHRR